MLKTINEIKNTFILIAISGIVFALFALIHNEEYVKIGLLTFTYGVIADRANNILWKLYCEPKNKPELLYVLDSVLLIIWVCLAMRFLPI